MNKETGIVVIIIIGIIMLFTIIFNEAQADFIDSGEVSFGVTYTEIDTPAPGKYNFTFGYVDARLYTDLLKTKNTTQGFAYTLRHKSQFKEADDLVDNTAGFGYFIRWGGNCGR